MRMFFRSVFSRIPKSQVIDTSRWRRSPSRSPHIDTYQYRSVYRIIFGWIFRMYEITKVDGYCNVLDLSEGLCCQPCIGFALIRFKSLHELFKFNESVYTDICIVYAYYGWIKHPQLNAAVQWLCHIIHVRLFLNA